nr:MAG: RNA dependent RNA polymerase [Leviviridae sp.]
MTERKRYVEDLKALYTNLFLDALSAFPTLGSDFEKDLSRLLTLIDDRGLHSVCEDLPAAGKHFDRCLSVGQYTRSGLPLTKRVSVTEQHPKFLRGLFKLIFDESGQLLKDYNDEAILFVRQIYYACKKMDYPCSDERVLHSVYEFVRTDEENPEPEEFWSNPTADFSEIRETFRGFAASEVYKQSFADAEVSVYADPSILLANLDTVSRFVSTSLGSYEPKDWCFRHGPGMVSDKDRYSNKYSWLNWSDRLENAFPIADCGYHNYASWANRVQCTEGEVGSEEPASRMVAVPKTLTKPRLIAGEPSEHQWCQQNIWHYFCTRVERSWLGAYITFRDQSRNQVFARQGSSSGEHDTLDLSSASDRVSCHFVGQLFRNNPELLLALQSSRTRFVRLDGIPYYRGPAVHTLRMFSTMGNACTFPVESIGFLTIILACVATQRKLRLTPRVLVDLAKEVAVFGDDLIVPNDSRPLVCVALEALGFRVNADKSFWIGKFRESCGVDAFNGVDVTPTYWKGPCTNGPESIASTVEVSNNFYKKWMLHTARYVAEAIERVEIPLITMDSGVCGFTSFVKPELGFTKNRYNEALQRWEAFVPMLLTSVRRTPITDDSALLQYFTENPEPHIAWSSGVMQKPRLKLRPRWVPLSDITS